MSTYIQFPNGYRGPVSAKVAEILATRPGHSIVYPRPGESVENTPAELAAQKKAFLASVDRHLGEEATV